MGTPKKKEPSQPSKKASAPESKSETKPENKKDELFWKILDAALKLELVKGHLRWKMTDLSRASGVTRSLIYYYFGQSKEAILQAAFDIMGEEIFGLSDARQALWSQGKIAESFHLTRKVVMNTPHLTVFYMAQRQPGAPFSDQFAALEKRYVQKLAARFPNTDPKLLKAVFATFVGLITIGDPSDEVLAKMVPLLLGVLA